MTEPLGENASSPKKPAGGRETAPLRDGERVCTACGRHFGLGTLFCPDDGTPLEARGVKTTDPYLGQVILDHIEIQKLAGVGAMGRVYRAFQRGLERDVAVKILHRELSSNKELVGRFIREAKLASRIVHPNVVQVHLAGQLPDGALYIVMEYLDGLSLQSAMAASPTGALALDRSLHVALQLCHAVGEAHGLGIVHRDLKPENVMLVRRGDDSNFVKVLDFGIARANQAEHTSMATAQGLIFGTARYISPEGARGEGATTASDVYSLAILFYQMFAGQTPFDAEQAVGLLLQHIHETPPPLTAPPSLPAIPVQVARVILDNLAKSPEERDENAKRFGEQLRRAAREAGLLLPELDSLSHRPTDIAKRPAAELGASTNMWTPGTELAIPVGKSMRVSGTEIAEPETRAPRATEYAEPDVRAGGLTEGGTLRLDTPPAALVARIAKSVEATPAPYTFKSAERTLPVLSRPHELARVHTPRLEDAYREPKPLRELEYRSRSRGWLLLLFIPVFLGIGLLLGGFFKPDPRRSRNDAVPPVPSVDLAKPTAPPTDVTPVLPDSELVGLLPEKRSSAPAPDPKPAANPTTPLADPKPGAVKVTVGRSMANPIPNHPLEFTAVVFDGADRAGSKVEASNFSFKGEGMSSILPAALDGQGIFRVQLTFYKPGSYEVVFGGLLHGKPIGGSHRFTIGAQGGAPAAPPTPPLPGPSAAEPAAPKPPAPPAAPKPPSSVQWL